MFHKGTSPYRNTLKWHLRSSFGSAQRVAGTSLDILGNVWKSVGNRQKSLTQKKLAGIP